MKFKFEASFVVEARGLEDAIAQVAAHLATVNRHVGNGETLASTGAEFSMSAVADDAVAADLQDSVTDSKGPTKLTLDPQSPQAKALAEQEQRQAAEQAALDKQLANAGKTDSEIMAEFSEAEQASHAEAAAQ